MPKGKSKSGKGKMPPNRMSQGPSPNLQSYNGPLSVPNAPSNRDMIVRRLCISSTITTTAGGVINNTLGSNLVTSTHSWSSWPAVYDEYRVLGMELFFEPLDQFTTATFHRGYVIVVVDNDDLTLALTSASQAGGYTSSRVRSLCRPWHMSCKATGAEHMQFSTTGGAPSAVYGFKLFSDGNSNTTVVGQYILYHIVQFLGGY